MYKSEKIKLIIWDLDETLWQGTLSEGSIDLSTKNELFLEQCLDRGIIHSICSKNDFENTKSKLIELNIWDKFVFPSIDWTPKGARIKQQIEDMALRPANVLFIDDNTSNLNEAIYFCPEIMTATPDDLDNVIKDILEKESNDKEHKRLNQYKILETKKIEKDSFDSNEQFLFSSGIRVDISYDCKSNIERISELIQRSNQLNYTKNRMGIDELSALIDDDSVNTGYVSVKDKFGDYGIVGFFAIKDNTAIHFTFSCRTLGMKVEQWTYVEVGCPHIEVVGEVITKLNNYEKPEWINMTEIDRPKDESKDKISGTVLFKGPCDMEQIFSFVEKNDNFISELTYVGSVGQAVEGHNTTPQIVSALTLTDEEKKEIISSFSWFDESMFDTSLCNKNIDFFIFSMLTDGHLGMYKSKKGNHYVSFCESYYDLTDPKNWDGYINGTICKQNFPFTKEDLKKFSEEYEKVDNSEGQLTLECLDKIYKSVGHKMSKIIILLGSEYNYPCPPEQVSFLNKHLLHKKINEKIRTWAADKSNITLLCFDDYATSEKDFVDTINHFVKRVYFDLTKDIIAALNVESFSRKSFLFLMKVQFKQIKSKIKWSIRLFFRDYIKPFFMFDKETLKRRWMHLKQKFEK